MGIVFEKLEMFLRSGKTTSKFFIFLVRQFFTGNQNYYSNT